MMYKTISMRYFFVLLILSMLFSCKKDGGSGTTDVPVVTVSNVSAVRLASDGTVRFNIYSSKSSSSSQTVEYTLQEGTALENTDFIPSAGTITIPANSTSAYIDIQVKGDPTNLRQANLYFNIVLNNPKNCKLGNTTAKATLITENGTYLPTDNTGYTTPLTYPGYNMVWNDEFTGTTLSSSSWNYETGNGVGGWGNNELQFYTGSTNNVFVSNGNLIIEARKEPMGGYNYSSARITTQGKRSFKFGRIDIRAKLPYGKGMWPALWMLGSNIGSVGWPACGEIDIMELIGSSPSTVYGTMHWKNAGGTNSSKGSNFGLAGQNFSQQFHVFSIVWSQDAIKWYVDDQEFLSTTKTDVGTANYPFNAEQFFIFNIAVGGNWPGSPDATTSFPQRMFVDYVRVFQQ